MQLSNEIRKYVNHSREHFLKTMRQLESERDAALIANRVENQVTILQSGDECLQPAIDHENHKKVCFYNYNQPLSTASPHNTDKIATLT